MGIAEILTELRERHKRSSRHYLFHVEISDTQIKLVANGGGMCGEELYNATHLLDERPLADQVRDLIPEVDEIICRPDNHYWPYFR